MSDSLKFLFCVTVILMAGNSVCGHPIAEHSSNITEDNGYYNIYSKIDSLEKDLYHLQTSVKNRNKLLKQVFLEFMELDVDPAMPDVDLKYLEVQTKSKNDTSVGFTTKLYPTTYSSSSSIIRGKTILYNGGNAYNGTLFTCPSPGLYLFHVSVLTDKKANGFWIYKNSQQLIIAYAGDRDSQWNVASVSAAVWLDVGDQVYLRPHNSQLYVNEQSVFTGVKVN